MKHKKIKVIILAMGWLLSICCVVGEQQPSFLERLDPSIADTTSTPRTDSAGASPTRGGSDIQTASTFAGAPESGLQQRSATTTGSSGGSVAGYEISHIDSYVIRQYTLSSPATNGVASIACYSGEFYVVLIVFLKDTASIQANSVPAEGNSCLYYPYSRYNDILSMIETGSAMFEKDSNHPEKACILLR
ncbi:MAG TPA: hypothetical protein PLS48_11910 [Methanotrichaceae archaeon]|nr:hypothetical protein [Methanotrichaceae archaeon]